MNNNITKLYAYQISDLLEKKIIDPVVLLELFINNFEVASKKTKYAFSNFLKKKP